MFRKNNHCNMCIRKESGASIDLVGLGITALIRSSVREGGGTATRPFSILT